MVARSITPAFAPGLVLVCVRTWAITLPLPGSVCDTKWNSSANPVMSAPPALIVHLPVLRG